MISTAEYLDFLDREYLRDFIKEGGAAVKFVIPTDDGCHQFLSHGLRDRSKAAGHLHVVIDAAETRVHMIDQVFFAVAQQVDWDGLAAGTLRHAMKVAGFPVDDGEDLALQRTASHHDFDPTELNREVNRVLQQELLRDFRMAQEFRIAMTRLCQHHLRPDDTANEHEAVLEWLHGTLSLITKLRTALIFQRIARHNARFMLVSLCRWLTKNGLTGLVLELDITRFARTKRPAEPQGLHYTKPAVMDAYEVLRQLIDGTDELTSCLTIVVAAPEFLTDETRGIDAYDALKMRIGDDVRDRRRDNPFAALVRVSIGSASEDEAS